MHPHDSEPFVSALGWKSHIRTYESCILMVEFLIQTKFENHIEWDHVVREFTCIDWLLVTNIDFYLTWASEWYFGLHDWLNDSWREVSTIGCVVLSWNVTSACSRDTLLELHLIKGLLLELLFAVSWKWDFLRKIWINFHYLP